MQTYVALLRGINVGGNKMIAMAELRAEVTRLGLDNVRTLLQSGNVVFQAKARPSGEFEHELEAAIYVRFGHSVSLLVRTLEELDAVIAANPYPVEAKSDPSHLLVTFLKSAPPASAVQSADEAVKGPEYFTVFGREIYAVYPAGIGTSKLPSISAWKKLVGGGTGRNWATVLKLATLVRE